MKKSLKAGFTLVELIAVVAIIGVLASVMIGFFSSSSERGMATKCKNNIRALAQAMNTCASQQDGSTHTRAYPAAGSFKYEVYHLKISYYERTGWISRGPAQSSKQVGAYINFSDEDNFKDENPSSGLKYALTKGALWDHVGKSRSIYQCPVHADACKKKNGRVPGWSYVLNSCFGWASNGKDPLKGWSGVHQGSLDEHVLMFAEIQGVDDAKYNLTANLDGKSERGDSVLQPDDEVIGFNHKSEKYGYYGHVAFCDGHVEEIYVPQTGMNVEELTEKLCAGAELSFDGNQYRDITK